MRTMTKTTFKTYKKYNNTIPRCVSCGEPILVGDKYERSKGARKTKYFCAKCAEKNVIVFQYPRPKKPHNKLGGGKWQTSKPTSVLPATQSGMRLN